MHKYLLLGEIATFSFFLFLFQVALGVFIVLTLGGRGSLLDRGGMSRVGARHVLVDGGRHSTAGGVVMVVVNR